MVMMMVVVMVMMLVMMMMETNPFTTGTQNFYNDTTTFPKQKKIKFIIQVLSISVKKPP
jgi:hypothetical protein